MDIDQFEKTDAQLSGLYKEITELSKKKPNDAINTFKLKFVNEIIECSNELLGDKYKPFSSFDVFNEDDLPTNSDVVVVLAQYINCLERLRMDNVVQEFGSWYWKVNGKGSDRKTYPPRRL